MLKNLFIYFYFENLLHTNYKRVSGICVNEDYRVGEMTCAFTVECLVAIGRTPHTNMDPSLSKVK